MQGMHESPDPLHAPSHTATRFDVTRWPQAVRSAELARGTLVRCGPGVRLAGWPETPEVRAEAMRQALEGQLIPVMLAAAWVWGCAQHPGVPIACSTQRGARPKLQPHPQLDVHEYRYPPGDLVALGTLTLPTPARTACDLVRMSEEFAVTTIVAIRLLLRAAGLSQAAWEVTLQAGPGRHRRRALARVAGFRS